MLFLEVFDDLFAEHGLEGLQNVGLVVLLEHVLEFGDLLALLAACDLFLPKDGELDCVRHALQTHLAQLVLALALLASTFMNLNVLDRVALLAKIAHDLIVLNYFQNNLRGFLKNAAVALAVWTYNINMRVLVRGSALIQIACWVDLLLVFYAVEKV